MSAAPLVSVGLPVYNGEALLRRALDSLLAQDFADFEIVICDNASQDRTEEIGREYAMLDPRVRYHRNPENIGLAGNFNRAFEISQGTYFKWAAHDDWHAPESLRLSVEALEGNPNAVLCATGVSIVDETGSEIGSWIPDPDLATDDVCRRVRFLLSTLGETHPMYGLVRSSALSRTRLVQSHVGSDRTMLAALSLLGPMVTVPQKLHFYTISATARRNYRPSLHYDPRNQDKLPLRTWRLIYQHLGLVRRSALKPHEKLLLAGSVLRRFGIRDFRRLAAEAYYSARIVTARSLRWLHAKPAQ
jgi:glycosyltransferase involved in cell wall biosynthesis